MSSKLATVWFNLLFSTYSYSHFQISSYN